MTDCIKCNKRPAMHGKTLCSVCDKAAYSNMAFHAYETRKGHRVKSIHQNRSYEPIRMNKGSSTAIKSYQPASYKGRNRASTRNTDRPKIPKNESWGHYSKPSSAPIRDLYQPKAPIQPRTTESEKRLIPSASSSGPQLIDQKSLIKGTKNKLKLTHIFHCLQEAKEQSASGLTNSLHSLYAEYGYEAKGGLPITNAPNEAILVGHQPQILLYGREDDIHSAVICDDYLVTNQALEVLLTIKATLHLVVVPVGRNATIEKLNSERIGRLLKVSKANELNVWLIFPGKPSSLIKVGVVDEPQSWMVSSLQYLLGLLAIERTRIDEGKMAPEEALANLQDELTAEISHLTKKRLR